MDSHAAARKKRKQKTEKPRTERRPSLTERRPSLNERRVSLSGSEEEFEADIKAPGDLPLPESMLGHERIHTEITPLEESKKIVDEEFKKLENETSLGSWADVVVEEPAADNIQKEKALENNQIENVEKPDVPKETFAFTPVNDARDPHEEMPASVPIRSLGPVSKQEIFSQLQDFQKELIAEALQSVQNENNEKATPPVEMKSLGPLDAPCEEFTHGFQKGLTLGAANVERPQHEPTAENSQSETQPEESSQQKNFLVRAVEKVAAAAGTVAGLLLPQTPAEYVPDQSPTKLPEESHTQDTLVESTEEIFEEEKGLVDTAIEKVWNLLTGKEELFPVENTSSPPPSMENPFLTQEEFIQEHAAQTELNPNAPTFIPSGLDSEQAPLLIPEQVEHHGLIAAPGAGMQVPAVGSVGNESVLASGGDVSGKAVQAGYHAA